MSDDTEYRHTVLRTGLSKFETMIRDSFVYGGAITTYIG